MSDEIQIHAGDIFRFGGPALGWGYGQVLISKTLQFVCILKNVIEEERIPSDLTEFVRDTPVLLAGWTMDARLQTGAWAIVGHVAERPSFRMPQYKVEIAGEVWLTDSEGKQLRPLSVREQRTLKYKSSHSPIAYEKAFWAFHGGAWENRFDDLLVPGD